jgi:hypothetical protein
VGSHVGEIDGGLCQQDLLHQFEIDDTEHHDAVRLPDTMGDAAYLVPASTNEAEYVSKYIEFDGDGSSFEFDHAKRDVDELREMFEKLVQDRARRCVGTVVEGAPAFRRGAPEP